VSAQGCSGAALHIWLHFKCKPQTQQGSRGGTEERCYAGGWVEGPPRAGTAAGVRGGGGSGRLAVAGSCGPASASPDCFASFSIMSDPSSQACRTCSWVRVLQARSILAVLGLFGGIWSRRVWGGATVLPQVQTESFWPGQGVQGCANNKTGSHLGAAGTAGACLLAAPCAPIGPRIATLHPTASRQPWTQQLASNPGSHVCPQQSARA
jgi:hypothetical protein